jgi:hypothetical protein
MFPELKKADTVGCGLFELRNDSRAGPQARRGRAHARVGRLVVMQPALYDVLGWVAEAFASRRWTLGARHRSCLRMGGTRVFRSLRPST